MTPVTRRFAGLIRTAIVIIIIGLVEILCRTGVIDPYHRLYGCDGLHVIDGSTLSANLGVNPSLSITAQAERATSLWPNKGEVDQRPLVGAGYRRLDPIAPAHPVVPDTAPAALRTVKLDTPTIRTA